MSAGWVEGGGGRSECVEDRFSVDRQAGEAGIAALVISIGSWISASARCVSRECRSWCRVRPLDASLNTFSGPAVGQPGLASLGVEGGEGGLVRRGGRDSGEEHGAVASPPLQAGQEAGGFGFSTDQLGAGVFADHHGTAVG